MSTFYGECEICVASNAECCGCEDTTKTMSHFLSKQVKERCSDCVSLISSNEHIWTCDSCGKSCMSVTICPEKL